jgi:Ca-activated chloride channel homolog
MSLLAPFGLLLGLLALPLLGLYFLKIRRRKVTVPSLLLWEELVRSEQMARPFDRFRRNLLLLLQLLILALVVLAFARPALDVGLSTARNVVLVVDTSASMAATDVRPTRLGGAVDEALATVSRLGPADEATLVVAGPDTRVAVPFTRERPRLREALSALAPTSAEGSLREGMELALSLARARPGVEIHVFSDGGHGTLADLPAGETPVRYQRIGREAGNAGILALDLRAAPGQELDRQAFVTVQRFGGRAAAATVQVFLGDELVGLRNVTLGDRPTSLVFDIPSGASGVVRVRLDAEDDHLDLDDEATAVLTPVRKRRVVLVGGDRLTRKVLDADPRVELQTVRGRALTPEQVARADALFLSEPVTTDVVGVPTAYLHPEAGGPARLGPPSDRPDVLGWRRTHPLMRFIAWEGVRVGEARTVGDAGGLSGLVDSTSGPLVLAGERQGARVVQLAFDPLKTDLPLRVAWPVLLLNTVGWLTAAESTGQDQVVRAGQPWTLRVPEDLDPDSLVIEAPDGTRPKAQVAGRLLRVQDTTTLGVYRVRAGEQRARFAVALLSPGESDLTPAQALDLGEAARAGQVAQAAATPGGPRELWRYLLLFGLVVLAVEWLVWTRRKAG